MLLTNCRSIRFVFYLNVWSSCFLYGHVGRRRFSHVIRNNLGHAQTLWATQVVGGNQRHAMFFLAHAQQVVFAEPRENSHHVVLPLQLALAPPTTSTHLEVAECTHRQECCDDDEEGETVQRCIRRLHATRRWPIVQVTTDQIKLLRHFRWLCDVTHTSICYPSVLSNQNVILSNNDREKVGQMWECDKLSSGLSVWQAIDEKNRKRMSSRFR